MIDLSAQTLAQAQDPALAGGEIDEGKVGRIRADEPLARVDRGEIVERCTVARQDQVVAVVDRHAKRCVVIGAATPARLHGSFMNDDAAAVDRKAHRGGEAREPGADHMDFSGTAHSKP